MMRGRCLSRRRRCDLGGGACDRSVKCASQWRRHYGRRLDAGKLHGQSRHPRSRRGGNKRRWCWDGRGAGGEWGGRGGTWRRGIARWHKDPARRQWVALGEAADLLSDEGQLRKTKAAAVQAAVHIFGGQAGVRSAGRGSRACLSILTEWGHFDACSSRLAGCQRRGGGVCLWPRGRGRKRRGACGGGGGERGRESGGWRRRAGRARLMTMACERQAEAALAAVDGSLRDDAIRARKRA